MDNDNLESIREKIQLLVNEYCKLSLKKSKFFPGVTPVQSSGKLIDFAEIRNLVDASLDGWLTTGRFNNQFETKLAEFLGVKHLLTVNSGSSANLLAISALTSPKLGEAAICPGDEVITVAAGFPTTINPIIQIGAIPVFIDVDLKTFNIDWTYIESAITPRTKAIVIAHTLGNPFNLAEITRICKKNQLWLVEDCCDSLGATYDEKIVGSFGDIGTLSFYPAHHITMGEGGAVFTNNNELKMILESFRDWGRDCYCSAGVDNTCGKRFSQKHGDLPYGYDHKYTYSHMGYNLKITDFQAACGLAQLEKLDQFILQRRANFDFIKQRLSNCSEYIDFVEATPNSNPSWFGFLMTLKETSPVSRVELIQYLDQQKIGSRLLFAGNVTRQPYMLNRKFKIFNNLKNTDYIMNNSFWVGIQPNLTFEMLEYTAFHIESYLGVRFN